MIVCDQCGHTSPHNDNPTLTVPYQPPGTTRHLDGGLVTNQCERATCFCNLYVPRDLLPTEPVL